MSMLSTTYGTSWGASTQPLLRVLGAMVHQTVEYFLPVLHGLSNTLEMWHHYVVRHSLQAFLVIPRATLGTLILARAIESPIPVLRKRKLLRHVLRLLCSHVGHPTLDMLLRRAGSNVFEIIRESDRIIPDCHH